MSLSSNGSPSHTVTVSCARAGAADQHTRAKSLVDAAVAGVIGLGDGALAGPRGLLGDVRARALLVQEQAANAAGERSVLLAV